MAGAAPRPPRLPHRPLTQPPASDDTGRAPDSPEDVTVGLAALTFGLGMQLGRLAASPGRALARTPLVRRRAGTIAAAGREAEAAGRRRLEEAASRLLAAPETTRAVNRALADGAPAPLDDEAVELLVQRVLASPAFERIVRDAAASPLARDLLHDAVRSPEVQDALEELLTGPAVRNALRRETKTFWVEVCTAVRRAAARLDAALERVIGRRSAEEAAGSPYGGLASRGAALLLDAVLTNGALLVTAALVGAAGSLLDLSLSGWVAAALAGSLGTVLIGGYFVLFWTTVGQTPGMRVLGLRVTDGAGRVLGTGRSLLRLAASVVAIAPLFLGFLPVLFDRRRRALQDFVARSVVVRDEPRGGPAQ